MRFIATLPLLTAARIVLELHLCLFGPLDTRQLLEHFMVGYRQARVSRRAELSKPIKGKALRDVQNGFRIALPRYMCVPVYAGWRKETERQRRWLEATETQALEGHKA